MTTHPIPSDPADNLQARSERLGLATRWHDFYGHEREVSPEALRDALAAMGQGDGAASTGGAASAWPPVCVVPEGDVIRVPLQEGMSQPTEQETQQGKPPVLLLEDGSRREGRWEHECAVFDTVPTGYHRVLHNARDCTLIVCPHRAWLPEPLTTGARWWGAAVQVYALRSESNWGVGDFSDLARLVDVLAAQGAAFVGLNPLHALFAHRPQDASPYSPSSRNAINPLYLDIEAMPDFHESREARSLADREEFRRTLAALRDANEVDYPGVAAVKRPMFEQLWKSFRARHLANGSARAQQWRRFMAAHPHLQQHALFEALQAHLFTADAQVWGWPAWPPAYRDPAGPAVARFAQEQAERVGFYGWLQWQADQQLEAVQARARAAGMPLGLYRDLAVGANEGGSEVWARQDAYALGVQVGAPPDPLNALGQNWGLPPFNPQRLTAGRYEAFVELVRANMRHAGALRLDHVMGLMRLFWTGPHGGTYMKYPLADLLGILALESTRHRCMVIGEDLGNVAPRMREAMREQAVLSYCPLYFERTDSGDFRPPAEWRPQALAVVSTHDLPTLRGWWRGEDIELSARLGLYPPDGETGSHSRQVVERATGRALLMLALEREGLLPEGASVHPTSLADATPGFTQAVYAFLSRTPCLLLGVQLEDVTQQLVQVNIPGTQETQYPNWRRKLPVTVEDLAADRRMAGVAAALAARRVLRGEGDDTAAGVDAGAVLDVLQVPALSTARIPLATYRLQFHAGFTFADATRVVPYLAALGISHLYASPWQAARAGSTHGYDVVDHNALNPELGDEDSFAAMCQAVARHGMHQMLDIVPNHMGVLEADNAWWLDVLEHGPASLQAETFDIDWNPTAPEMAGRVLLPVLGDHYGRVLERGELTLVFDAAGSFHVGYYKHRFPVDPADYAAILSAVPVPPVAQHAAVASLLHALAQLPARSDTSADARATRARDARLHKRALAAHVAGDAQLAAWAAACVLAHSGTPGDAHSFDALDALLARQAWRLAYWRVAGDDINYRRFFDINTLAALRMERPQVFEATHRKLLRWLQDGSVAALRIDHPDGLADPRAYFERLQSRQAEAAERAGLPRRALYLVVEKILAENEDLPADWPVHGGTGYRFSNLVNGLFVDPRNEAAFTQVYSDFTGAPADFDDVLYEAKHLIMDVALASDLQWLTESLYRISRRSRLTCDFTRNGLRAALAEVAAAFTVYRTYLTGDGAAGPADLRYLDQALRRARRRGVAADLSALDHLRDVLLHGDDKAFIARWQQFTAPVMAKSMEDTAFYRYHRLVSLNDVGGDPRSFGVSPAAFHTACAAQAATRPHWLLGTSTHDSKRSEDLRARLDVLSEMPDVWQAAVLAWQAMNTPAAGEPVGLTRNDEYLLYQTLVGVWPVTPEGVLPTQDALHALQQRVQDYMRKALREAKRETSWLNPDEAYENAAAAFIAALFGRREFLQALQQFVNRIAPLGFANSLNLVAIKLTAPGVPDIYQGCEQWSFNLVDPDNRRPVDFAALQAQLQAVQALYAAGAWPTAAQWQALRAMPSAAGPGVADGRIKQLLTWRLLQLRRQAPDVFCHGGHVPLVSEGAAAGHVLAYERVLPAPAESERTGGALQQVIVVASRLPHTRAQSAYGDGWHDTRLALPERGRESGWSDWFTGRAVAPPGAGSVALAELMAVLPVAVLVPTAWLRASDAAA